MNYREIQKDDIECHCFALITSKNSPVHRWQRPFYSAFRIPHSAIA
jgi:hypothetical protein